jgi:hypothetical protein
MTGPGGVAPLAARGIAGGAAALAAYFLWRSLAWPLVHDAAGMHYIAWLIANGAAPYCEVFDQRYAIAVEGNGYRIYARRAGG